MYRLILAFALTGCGVANRPAAGTYSMLATLEQDTCSPQMFIPYEQFESQVEHGTRPDSFTVTLPRLRQVPGVQTETMQQLVEHGRGRYDAHYQPPDNAGNVAMTVDLIERTDGFFTVRRTAEWTNVERQAGALANFPTADCVTIDTLTFLPR